jgi:hypothetical protein
VSSSYSVRSAYLAIERRWFRCCALSFSWYGTLASPTDCRVRLITSYQATEGQRTSSFSLRPGYLPGDSLPCMLPDVLGSVPQSIPGIPLIWSPMAYSQSPSRPSPSQMDTCHGTVNCRITGPWTLTRGSQNSQSHPWPSFGGPSEILSNLLGL